MVPEVVSGRFGVNFEVIFGIILDTTGAIKSRLRLQNARVSEAMNAFVNYAIFAYFSFAFSHFCACCIDHFTLSRLPGRSQGCFFVCFTIFGLSEPLRRGVCFKALLSGPRGRFGVIFELILGIILELTFSSRLRSSD